MVVPALPGSSVTSGATSVLPIFRAIISPCSLLLMLCLASARFALLSSTPPVMTSTVV
jgi:hypothetical protein